MLKVRNASVAIYVTLKCQGAAIVCVSDKRYYGVVLTIINGGEARR